LETWRLGGLEAWRAAGVSRRLNGEPPASAGGGPGGVGAWRAPRRQTAVGELEPSKYNKRGYTSLL